MWVTPIVHPSHVLRQNARLIGTLQHGFERAYKLSNGSWSPTWTTSEYKLKPTADEVVSILRSMHGKRVAFDVETDGRHMLENQLRCAAFFDGTKAVCVPFLYRDGTREEYIKPDGKIGSRSVWKPYYTGAALKKVLEAIRAITRNAFFIYQNGQYDRTVMRAQTGIIFPSGADKAFDTILGHHIVSPYLPHGLGFMGALYTEAPFYKATDAGDSWASESDYELWLYCCNDVKVTWIAAAKIEKELGLLPQNPALYEHDAWQEVQCEQWTRTGVLLDREALAYYRMHYKAVAAKSLEKLREIVANRLKNGSKDEFLEGLLEKFAATDEEVQEDSGAVSEKFNPASLRQLRLMLQHLGIPLSELTATGDLSTAKEFLTGARKELLAQNVSPKDDRIAFLDFLFARRESTKVDSTYLYPETLADQRVHPGYSNFVTPTGRLNSRNPNFQNQPPEIRGMYVAKPGFKLVSGDWDALEMRLGPYMSGDPAYLKVFQDYDSGVGMKPHIVNASRIFGLPLTKDLADLHPARYTAAKTFAYALAYGASEQTVYEQCREQMPDLKWETFQECYRNYRAAYPVLFRFQEEQVEQGTQKGYLDTPILKRRTFFFEKTYGRQSPEAGAMQNYKYQGGGADVVGLANRRIVVEVVEPWKQRGKEVDQLSQVHDELLFEVAENITDEFVSEFKRVGERVPGPEFAHWHLPLDIKAKKRWKPVQARCGAALNDGAKCKLMVDVEPVKRTKKNVTWGGVCCGPKGQGGCGAKKQIEVPRELEAA